MIKTNTKRSRQASTPQTVTGPIKLKSGARSIQITTTNKKISAHGGQAAFAAFLVGQRLRETLSRAFAAATDEPECAGPGGDCPGVYGGGFGRGGQAHAGGVAAGRPRFAGGLEPAAIAESVDVVAILCRLSHGGPFAGLLPAAVALGDGAVAAAGRGLHP